MEMRVTFGIENTQSIKEVHVFGSVPYSESSRSSTKNWQSYKERERERERERLRMIIETIHSV
jgi:hypothetical protein